MPLQKHNKCPNCAHAQLEELENYTNHHLVQCKSCGFIFASIIPDSALMEAFYNDNYDRTSYFSPITKIRYEQLLDSWESYRKTNKLLDIGCGNGFFLQVAKEKGWDVYGVEVSESASEICRNKGLNVFTGIVDEFKQENDFDIIVSIEVIEHLSFPRSFVEAAYQLLRKGGLFYMTTPNFNAVLRYRLKEQYDVIDFPNHVSYFTPTTLDQLLTESGFSKKSIKTTGYSVTRRRTSKGQSNQEYVSETSDDEMLRHRIEHNAFLRIMKGSTNSILNTFKIGDSIKALYEKK